MSSDDDKDAFKDVLEVLPTFDTKRVISGILGCMWILALLLILYRDYISERYWWYN